MIGDVCAVKRDVRRILETPYPVDLLQFKVDVISSNTPLLSTGQLYSIRQEGENYYLFHLLTQLDFYIKIPSSIEFWREGMVVGILNKNDMKVGTGCLIHKGIDMDKALTKEEILASDCVIKSEYQTLFDNASNTQLIPEKYLLKPSNPPTSVTFYYDSRYLSVTRENLSIYEIEKVDGDYSNLSEREIDKQISPLNQKSSAKSYIVCQIGDILKVEEKEHPDYEYGSLTIGGIWDYNSTSNVELIKSNKTSSLSFEITLDCFATFTIYSPKYKITASVPGVYTAPTEEGEIALLPDGYDFGFTLLANDESIPTYAKEGQEINLSMELANYPSDVSKENLFYISPIVTVTYLENGISQAKYLSPGIFNATTTTSTCSFTMPAADCHITVKLKLTGDGADQFVEPTGGESGYALVVTGNIESVTIDGSYNTIPAMVIALDKVNVSFTRKLGYSYTYSLYYTAAGTTLKSGVILSDYIEVDVWNDLTLNILELETDCIYTSATGKLALDKNWDNDNPIIGHNYYDNRSYAIDTENPLLTSGINNTFRNKSVTQVTFNTTLDDFHIYDNAFKDCNILTTVSVNGPTSISIGSSAFENTTSLQKINGSENIIRLSEKSFKNSGLLEYNSNIEITNIPKYTFLDCDRLSNVSLHNSPLSIINERAFENCSNLKTISVPKCIKEIGVYSFSNSGIPAISTSTTPQLLAGCTFITDNGRTELSVIKEGVFKGCTSLKDIELPDSIEHLETLSFAECDNIQNFASPGLKTLELGVFLNTWIEKKHKYNSDEMETHSTYGTNSGKIYKYKNTEGIYFDYCRGILNQPNDHVVCIKPNPDKHNYILYKRPCPFSGNENVYFHAPIFGIADYGFAYKDTINWLNPYSVDFNAYAPLGHLEYIGKYAFKDSGVKFVQFNGNSLHTLGEGAFYNCRALRNVFGLEESLVTKIEPYTFYNCGGDYYGIGWYDGSTSEPALDFCIPQNTTSIGDYAFYNCRQLMGIKNHALCPIKKIGKYAFSRCFRNTHNIWDAVIYTTLFAIKTAATIYCSWYICGGPGVSWGSFLHASVLKVWLNPNVIPSVYSAGWKAVDIIHAVGAVGGIAEFVTGASTGWGDDNEAYPSSLAYSVQSCVRAAKTRSNLIFPHLEELGEGAFSECTYLGRIVVGNGVTEIPDYAFYKCTRLLGVDFCENVNWDDTSGASKFFVDSNIQTIGSYSFSKCKHLQYMSIDAMLKSAKHVKEGAFKDSVIEYPDYENETDGSVESYLTIPATLTTLEAGSLGFNRKNRFIFISDDPTQKQYSPDTFDGGTGYKIYLIVPKGSKDAYANLFKKHVKSENIYEVDKSDNLWKEHHSMGYTIPWLEENN